MFSGSVHMESASYSFSTSSTLLSTLSKALCSYRGFQCTLQTGNQNGRENWPIRLMIMPILGHGHQPDWPIFTSVLTSLYMAVPA